MRIAFSHLAVVAAMFGLVPDALARPLASDLAPCSGNGPDCNHLVTRGGKFDGEELLKAIDKKKNVADGYKTPEQITKKMTENKPKYEKAQHAGDVNSQDKYHKNYVLDSRVQKGLHLSTAPTSDLESFYKEIGLPTDGQYTQQITYSMNPLKAGAKNHIEDAFVTTRVSENDAIVLKAFQKFDANSVKYDNKGNYIGGATEGDVAAGRITASDVVWEHVLAAIGEAGAKKIKAVTQHYVINEGTRREILEAYKATNTPIEKALVLDAKNKDHAPLLEKLAFGTDNGYMNSRLVATHHVGLGNPTISKIAVRPYNTKAKDGQEAILTTFLR